MAPRWTILNRLATFHLVLVTWVFFRAASIGDALTVRNDVLLARYRKNYAPELETFLQHHRNTTFYLDAAATEKGAIGWWQRDREPVE